MGTPSILLVLTALLPGQQPGVDFYHDFRGGKPLPTQLSLMGPAPEDHIKPEAEGLRIRPPQNGQQTMGWGVLTTFPLSGDFEVTGRFEILTIDPPTTQGGAGVALNLLHDGQRSKFAKVGRFRFLTGGEAFVAECWGKLLPAPPVWEDFPTRAKSGRLRLAREGSMLRFLVAEGEEADFQKIWELEFGAEDVESARFIVNNNKSPTALDVRLIDFQVRTGNPAAVPLPAVTAKAGPAVLLLVLVGLMLVLVLIGLAVWLRQRRRTAVKLATEVVDEPESKPQTARRVRQGSE